MALRQREQKRLTRPVRYRRQELSCAVFQLRRQSNSEPRRLALLPEDLRPAFSPCLIQEKGYDREVVKAADRISAYIKCLEEKRAGNREFDYAAENVRQSLDAVSLPEVHDFLRDFLPAFEMTLDELNHPTNESSGGSCL